MFPRARLSRVQGRDVFRSYSWPVFPSPCSPRVGNPSPSTIFEPISVTRVALEKSTRSPWKNRTRVCPGRIGSNSKHRLREREREGRAEDEHKREKRQLASVPATQRSDDFSVRVLDTLFRREKSWSLTFDGSRLGRPGQRATLFFHGRLFLLPPPYLILRGLPDLSYVAVQREEQRHQRWWMRERTGHDACAVYCLLSPLIGFHPSSRSKGFLVFFWNVIFVQVSGCFFFTLQGYGISWNIKG